MIASLKSFGETLPQLVSNVSAENAKWKPPSQNWSILEIVCHLVDEEVEDFRRRVQMTLEDPSQEWASINPEIWAVERKYNEQNLQEKVQAFVAERTKSIDWLEGLSGADWNKAYQHRHFGPMRAGDLLVLGQHTINCTCVKSPNENSNSSDATQVIMLPTTLAIGTRLSTPVTLATDQRR